MSNYPTPYRQKFTTTYIKYSQLLCKQESIGWDNLLCGKFSKQWRFYQNYYEACRKNANRVATAWTTAQLTPAQRRKKKKQKPNVFHQIISSLFDAASAMWKQRNSDRHRRENGTNISVETKIDCTIRNLYGKKLSVMHNDVDTYYNVDIKTRLNHSLQLKKDWII